MTNIFINGKNHFFTLSFSVFSCMLLITACTPDSLASIPDANAVVLQKSLPDGTLFYSKNSEQFYFINHEPVDGFFPSLIEEIEEIAETILIKDAEGKVIEYSLEPIDLKEKSSNFLFIQGYSVFSGSNVKEALLTDLAAGKEGAVSLTWNKNINGYVTCKCRKNDTHVPDTDPCDSGGVGSVRCEISTGSQIGPVENELTCKVKCVQGFYACCNKVGV